MFYQELKDVVNSPEFKQKVIRDTIANLAKIEKLTKNGLTEQEAIQVLLDEQRANEPVIIH